jgi:hypothetical protein
MGRLGLWLGSAAMIGVSTMAASPLSASTAVQYYVNVQPIDVCPTGGTGTAGCAPVNQPGTTGIGFFNSAGTDITRAILHQAGIDVNYLPTQYIYNTSLQSLLVEQGATPGQLTSSQLQTLTDQSEISMGSPPAPPLAANAHTINMFFVNSLVDGPGVTGTYFGLSWIGNNGVSIAMNSFGVIARGQIVDAVPDTLAHEIVHNLGLDHPTDNPGVPTNDLMSVPRIEPTIANAVSSLGAGLGAGATDQLNAAQVAQIRNPNGGPLNSFLNPIPNITTSITPADPILVAQCVEFAACWTSGTPTPWSDTLTSAELASLGLGATQPFVAGQTSESVIRLGATTITFTTPTGPLTESLPQFNGLASHSDPCNFCEIDTVGTFSIPADATAATISGTFGNSVVPNSAGTNLCLGAGPPCAATPPVANDFSVSFPSGGRPGESLLDLTLTAPANVLFDPASFLALSLDGDTPGIIGTPTFSDCSNPDDIGSRCGVMQLAFTGTPFVLGDQYDYSLDFCLLSGEECSADTNVNDLAGGTYAYQFSDGYQTTSLLQLVDGALTANSQDPDLTTPTGLDLALFTPFSTSLPCALQPPATTCPALDLNADDIDQLIFQESVPEPPSIAIILAGLGLWVGLDNRRRRRAPRPC